LKDYLSNELLYSYVNADDIEKKLRIDGYLDFKSFGVRANSEVFFDYLVQSNWLLTYKPEIQSTSFQWIDGVMHVGNISVDSYVASEIAAFIRDQLIKNKISFTFETVMSHSSKLEIMAKSRNSGYRTYLYFIATEDPEINIARVKNRVRNGGHDVPIDRIVDRYMKSLENLYQAVKLANRAYIFDNSYDGSKETWIAEITNGDKIEIKSDFVPSWVKRSLLDKLTG
jgi:predicted ABC-type ATPase